MPKYSRSDRNLKPKTRGSYSQVLSSKGLLFTCVKCRQFFTGRGFQKHQRNVHSIPNTFCPFCTTYSSKKIDYDHRSQCAKKHAIPKPIGNNIENISGNFANSFRDELNKLNIEVGISTDDLENNLNKVE